MAWHAVFSGFYFWLACGVPGRQAAWWVVGGVACAKIRNVIVCCLTLIPAMAVVPGGGAARRCCGWAALLAWLAASLFPRSSAGAVTVAAAAAAGSGSSHQSAAAAAHAEAAAGLRASAGLDAQGPRVASRVGPGGEVAAEDADAAVEHKERVLVRLLWIRHGLSCANVLDQCLRQPEALANLTLDARDRKTRDWMRAVDQVLQGSNSGGALLLASPCE